jgi:hypothetical protein
MKILRQMTFPELAKASQLNLRESVAKQQWHLSFTIAKIIIDVQLFAKFEYVRRRRGFSTRD